MTWRCTPPRDLPTARLRTAGAPRIRWRRSGAGSASSRCCCIRAPGEARPLPTFARTWSGCARGARTASAARAAERMAAESPQQPGATRCANAIFQQPWWLEAVAPGRWGEATVERDGRVVARLPYVVRGRPRLRILTMPPLTQTLGPWLEPSVAKPAHALGEEHELLGALEAALPQADAFMQHFSPTMRNALPFHWAGYRLAPRHPPPLGGLRPPPGLGGAPRGRRRPGLPQAPAPDHLRAGGGLGHPHGAWGHTLR